MIKTRIIKREYDSLAIKTAVPLLAILLALLVGGLFLYFSGYNPGETFLRMYKGAFGSSYAIS